MSTPSEIIEFWFEGVEDPDTFDKTKNPFRKWFAKNELFDEEIRDRFEEDLVRAAGGEMDSWAESPGGRLALILMFDQFSRNMYRGTSQAFATDPLALDLSERSVKDGFDRQLSLLKRTFIYLPFSHSENLKHQNEHLRLLEELIADSRKQFPHNVAYFEYHLPFARRHREIIERFGRFPHRNAALNRTSTPQEMEFLKSPNSRF